MANQSKIVQIKNEWFVDVMVVKKGIRIIGWTEPDFWLELA